MIETLNYTPAHGNYLDSPACSQDFMKFLGTNAVKGLIRTELSGSSPDLLGKTIEYIEFSDRWDLFGFTDGTFAIRYKPSRDESSISRYSGGYSVSFVPTATVVFRGHLNGGYNYSDPLDLLVTAFGKWLSEKTGLRVYEFAGKLLAEELVLQEKTKEQEKQRDIEQYEYLKKKLGYV